MLFEMISQNHLQKPKSVPVFADIHCHMLYGLDDGAQDVSQMRRMLHTAYDGGTRFICFTPHAPGRMSFSYDRITMEQHFAVAREYASKALPQLQLALGVEWYADETFLMRLKSGERLQTLGKSRALLLEFAPDVLYFTMQHTVQTLCEKGYLPILAHAERYRCLVSAPWHLSSLRASGARLQCNADAYLGYRGVALRRFVCRALQDGQVDLLCSDAHDLMNRPPDLHAAYARLCRKFNKPLADALCRKNAVSLLRTTWTDVGANLP